MSDLYAPWVLEHSQTPHHQGRLDGSTHSARCDNPLCGDRVTVHARVADGRIAALTFEARGCAVATACASRMADLLQDVSVDDARALAAAADQATRAEAPPPPADLEHLAIVRAVSSRRRCAALPWQALVQALVQALDA